MTITIKLYCKFITVLEFELTRVRNALFAFDKFAAQNRCLFYLRLGLRISSDHDPEHILFISDNNVLVRRTNESVGAAGNQHL